MNQNKIYVGNKARGIATPLGLVVRQELHVLGGHIGKGLLELECHLAIHRAEANAVEMAGERGARHHPMHDHNSLARIHHASLGEHDLNDQVIVGGP